MCSLYIVCRGYYALEESVLVKLYISCIRNAFKNKLLLLFVLLSMTAAMLCVNITLASAQHEYESTLGINYFSTITISADKEFAENEDIYDTLTSLFPNNLKNVLYITKTPDNSTLIGWQGYNITNWFAHIDGRFFSYDEVESNEKAVYISFDEYGDLIKSGVSDDGINIDGENYKIVGSGFLTPFNFMSPISEESPQKIFISKKSSDYSFRIIPYTTFFQSYSPELILVHFYSNTYSQLKEKAEILKECFSEAVITMPEENSNEYLFNQKAVRGSIGVILSLLIYISVIGIMQEWLKINSKRYYVFTLCGANQRKIILLILLEWLTYVTAAVLLALGIQYCLLPFLSMLKAGYMPTLTEVLVHLITFYLFIVLFSLKKIRKITDIKSRGGVL